MRESDWFVFLWKCWPSSTTCIRFTPVGSMCTLLLTGAIAGLFGCMSAVRCHRRFVFAICLAITLLDFVPLAVLLSHLLTGETLSPILWTVALLLTVLSLFRVVYAVA